MMSGRPKYRSDFYFHRRADKDGRAAGQKRGLKNENRLGLRSLESRTFVRMQRLSEFLPHPR
jgi:hypothetical protein